MNRAAPYRIGIAGFGTVGRAVARAVDGDGSIGVLSGIASGSAEKADTAARQLNLSAPVVPIETLVESSDVIVECAPAHAFYDIARPALERGRLLVACTTAGLANHLDLVDLAKATAGRILVPSCSLPGIDGVVAAAQGNIRSALIVTRKPPSSLEGSPYLRQLGIDLTQMQEAVCVFTGSARQAASAFPANVNVAATLGLSGLGLDATAIEIWADPHIDRNTHRFEIDADATRFLVEVANVPDEHNPRTGLLTANGVIALLRKLSASLVMGV